MVRPRIDFRHMRAVGIHITDTAMTVAEVRQRFGSYTLRAVNQQHASTPFVADGLFTDIPQLAESIRQALAGAKPQAIQISAAHFCVPESVVFTHVFSFPRELDAKAIQEAVDIQFSEYFPFDMDNAAYDWKVVQESDQTQMILVAACDRQYVDQIVQLARELRLEIAGIDIESTSCARAVLPELTNSDTALVVDLGTKVTSLSIFGEEGLQSTLVLEIGNTKLTNLIREKMRVRQAEAIAIQSQLSLAADTTSQPELVELLHHHFHPIIEEMKRSMRFFEASRKRGVTDVLITGEGSGIAGLVAFLTDKVEQPVRSASPVYRLKAQSLVSPEHATGYATAIGLALGGADRRFDRTRYTIHRYIDTSIL